MKYIIVIVIVVITLFFAAYFMTGLAVNMIMGDKVYGQNIDVSARVDGLQVKDNYGKQSDQFYRPQPAHNINQLTTESL